MKQKYAIDSSEEVYYFGQPYYLRIRSQCENLPVVLFLHGGPGTPDRAMVMKYHSQLASVCTMVCWDQRGAGAAYRTKRAKEETLTKELYVEDAHNVICYLKKRFRKDKIILVGHSFGTQLGVWLLERYSADIAAYVSISQFVDSVLNEQLSYDFTLKQAKERKEQRAVEVLQNIAPVNGIYPKGGFDTQRKYLRRYGGLKYSYHKGVVAQYLPMIPDFIKEYGVRGFIGYLRGIAHLMNSPLIEERDHFLESVKKLDVPVVVMLGRHDYECPAALAEQWFTQLSAPQKKLFWFERSAHTPQDEESEKWDNVFMEEVVKAYGK